MTGAADWQSRTGAAWAAEWARTDRSFAALDPHLLEAALAGLYADAAVLDVGCGAGGTSLAVQAARPESAITGIDLSENLIEVARQRAAALAGRRPQFRVGDASASGEGGFDRIVSRHGVMFFADPVAAMARLRGRLRPGGAITFSCFRERAANPWATEPIAVLGIGASAAVGGQAGGPGPFAFANHDEVARILSRAGWAAIEAKPVDYRYIAGQGPDAVVEAVALLRRIGPAAPELVAAPPERRTELLERLEHFLADRLIDGIVSFPATAWIWTARNPD
ncbi:class I SAM-dependent methyltransferase [Sphingomonas sp.]|uniref:class I SAM-dependent methyltransferase n=1 Tax=Sphingomonas sp. TaxID=28214 RepID=UPI002C56F7D8|nr:class I SAM-dependent methyltransferase [Sphingomonas sp.]HTG39657.1 class I SAM-dependent methyltransferase [Sphingomonas sp.]